jgi:hypothetical protein
VSATTGRRWKEQNVELPITNKICQNMAQYLQLKITKCSHYKGLKDETQMHVWQLKLSHIRNKSFMMFRMKVTHQPERKETIIALKLFNGSQQVTKRNGFRQRYQNEVCITSSDSSDCSNTVHSIINIFKHQESVVKMLLPSASIFYT